MHATPFSVEDVLLLAKRYPSARGLRRLRAALPLVDGGAEAPKETWLRLLLIDAGLPTPTTQVPALDGYWPVAFLDMGWQKYKVASNMTATSIAAIAAGTSKTSGGCASLRRWAGSSSG